MDERTERTWDRLEADWQAARDAVAEHWRVGKAGVGDAAWRRELAALDEREQTARDAFMKFAGHTARGRAPYQSEIVYRGGPRDSQHDWMPTGTDRIGASERVGGELVASQGTYGATGERDSGGRLIFQWEPLAES